MPVSLLAKMRERAEKLGVSVATVVAAGDDLEDYLQFVPDDDGPSRQRSPEEEELDAVLDRIDISEAYIRWCGKMEPIQNGKRESVMISCPIPGHEDKHPSAWMNLDKGTWFCGACDQGGDKYDIAAFRFNIPNYKDKSEFPKLRHLMAEDLGFTVRRTPAGVEQAVPVIQDEDDGPHVTPEIVSMPATDLPWDMRNFTEIPYNDVIRTGSFLDEWMKLAYEDDLPVEYYFWCGLQALGLAVGNDVRLMDSPRIYGNLYVCLVGPSGIGKSRAIASLVTLLRDALPYDRSDPFSTGSYIAPPVSSAESLIDCFSRPVYGDPADPAKITDYAPVRGIVRFAELSALTGRTTRGGNILKPTLMEFYDTYDEVSTQSRGHGATIARSPFAQVCTTTQPRAIAELFEKTDEHSGFLNRWVFAVGKPRQPRAYKGANIDPTRCSDLLRGCRAWSTGHSGGGRDLDLIGPALDRWTQFFTKQVTIHKLTDEEPLLSRLDLLLKKLILLLAVNEHEDIITVEIVDKAIALYEYLLFSYGKLRRYMGLGDFEDCRQRIIETAMDMEKKTGKPPSMRDIQRATRKYQLPLVVKVFEAMLKVGELVAEEYRPRTGRPTERYRYAG